LSSRLVLALGVVLLLQACSPAACPTCPVQKCPDPAPEAPAQPCALLAEYQDLPRPQNVGLRSEYRPEFRTVLTGFFSGFGDRISTRLTTPDREVVTLWKLARDSGASVNAQALWLTRDFDETWMSAGDLEVMSDAGVLPVLLLYYFGGEISRSSVIQQRRDWYFFLIRVAAVAAIHRPVLVIFEPEFNDEGNEAERLALDWPGFNEIMIDGMYLLRSMAPNVLVGLCPGDFGEQNLERSAGEAIQYSDFIAYQEMRAVTRESGMTEESEDVSDRALAYASFLSQKFEKPLLLAYVAVSSYDPEGGRWEGYQSDVVSNLFDMTGGLRDLGVFGVLYFELLDDPLHEGYFGPAEKHFGFMTSSGKPKPAFKTYVQNLAQRPDLLTDWRPE